MSNTGLFAAVTYCMLLVNRAKAKWRYFRDYYRRSKSLHSVTKSGQAAESKPAWKYQQLMQFLDIHLQNAA